MISAGLFLLIWSRAQGTSWLGEACILLDSLRASQERKSYTLSQAVI
jgi:hypothetical protein